MTLSAMSATSASTGIKNLNLALNIKTPLVLFVPLHCTPFGFTMLTQNRRCFLRKIATGFVRAATMPFFVTFPAFCACGGAPALSQLYLQGSRRKGAVGVFCYIIILFYINVCVICTYDTKTAGSCLFKVIYFTRWYSTQSIKIKLYA